MNVKYIIQNEGGEPGSENVIINVNEVKSEIFKILNQSVFLYNDEELLNEMNVTRIDDDNSQLLSVSDNKECSIYSNYKYKSEDIYGIERPLTLEMISNYTIQDSKVSILKVSQHGDLKNGNTELYANNKGLIYIHRGILYQNIPIYVDIKFDYNVETQEQAELTILIYLQPSPISEFLLGLLYQQVSPDLPSELLLQNEIINSEYIIRINFLPGLEINDLLGTGLSFLYNKSSEKKGIELLLKDDESSYLLSIRIDTSILNDPRIIYTRTKEDGMDDNILPDIKIYTISNDTIGYNSNTTGNASDDALAAVFNDGVTIEYESIGNIHELAIQASGDREYPSFVIDGNMPDNYKKDTNDSTSAQERLNRIPFGFEGYINVIPESKLTINLNKGWNLIGSSYDGIIEDSESIIIPNTLYAYDNSYVTSTEINANKGYWIKCNSEGKIYLDIDETTKSTNIQVNKGWNLIGSSINGTLEDTESIIIPNTLYAYDNSYMTSTEINANKGYWIKCKNSGTIKLQ